MKTENTKGYLQKMDKHYYIGKNDTPPTTRLTSNAEFAMRLPAQKLHFNFIKLNANIH